ncbi:hypothetical protein IE53DRAFT_383531 [Violaceomyces palustris]|uniref:Uncharacterized protein n=1 Tax=Violaceomyces palustris TaxID=1673888 RepID=A0ACD0P7D0_9BASI|nr:hypothetical protein IE53DRAFT_383531 [Violaceomyces palustris]
MTTTGHPPQRLLETFLSTVERDIVPLTAKGVQQGSKVFGAAIFHKDTLQPIVVQTNNETESPLLHGEINTIQTFYRMDRSSRPDPKDCIFFSTHEPCSLCLSGITWSGFRSHYFLFTYEETRDTFSIPYDIQILEQVFRVPSTCPQETKEQLESRPLYNKDNQFWNARSVTELVQGVEGAEERDRYASWSRKVKEMYNGLSEVYQKGKGNVGIPLA